MKVFHSLIKKEHTSEDVPDKNTIPNDIWHSWESLRIEEELSFLSNWEVSDFLDLLKSCPLSICRRLHRIELWWLYDEASPNPCSILPLIQNPIMEISERIDWLIYCIRPEGQKINRAGMSCGSLNSGPSSLGASASTREQFWARSLEWTLWRKTLGLSGTTIDAQEFLPRRGNVCTGRRQWCLV